jgi:predicted DNA binding CopG/RHH family protein
MKNIPKINTEEEETEFWQNHDSTQYVNWKESKSVTFSNLKPTTRSISLRLPEMVLFRLKQEANKLNIPYQSLLKILISEDLSRRQNL